MTVPQRVRWLAFAVLFLSSVFGPADVAPAAEPAGQYAVLIGVDAYQHAPPLRFAVSDTLRLSQTLRRYGGYRSADVLQLVDAAADPAQHPTRDNLLAELPRWLSKAGENDRVLIAFSGHAFRANDGQLYLAAQDTDPTDLPATGVSVLWLQKQLAACPAQVKLLLLDTRQAAPEQADDDGPGVSAAELAEPLRNVPGLTVLAASGSTGNNRCSLAGWSKP